MNKFLTLLLVAAVVVSSSAIAAKGDSSSPNGNPIFSMVESNQPAVINGGGVPNSSVELSFDLNGMESWDAFDDADNIIQNCLSGTAITGVGWTSVGITTEGASWLSEAGVLFTNSDGSADPNGVSLLFGAGDDFTGSGTYDSGGVVNLADVALADVESNVDGLFVLQFFEDFDDVADTIDANYTGGTLTFEGVDLVATPGPNCMMLPPPPPPVVPANNTLALLLLVLSMLGFVAYRRFA
ncbi:hypothetical protein [Marinicella litoralis]|uniref:Secreted protein n=1 Tax=Marinicella litoralis TaxID=644220 RepID=A0A4R6XX53_9GAMM|nr:hypothetical protein [Marinicella litoralis]TDR23159.1 hypothetical protein C8D91_0017 [Marinicella litoralis]